MPVGADELGAWYDEAAAEAAVRFFTDHLRHTEAEWAGKPFDLQPWQAQILRTVFGWKRADGTRVVRTLYLEVPRKNGKTEFAAGLLLLILLGDGEVGGQVYSMAVDKSQAQIVFEKAITMVRQDAALDAEVECYKTAIYAPALTAAIKALSSSPSTKHGFSPTGAVADELHEWPDGDLYQVVHDGMGARRQPLEVLITTAGITGRGWGWEMHQRALRVADGTITDPEFLPVIYAAAADDDWTDEAVWAKANPNLGVSVKPDFLRSQARAASENPRLQNNFRRFHLNQWTEQAVRWLDLGQWDACAAPLPAAALEGRRCWGGLDLSRKVDISALALVFEPDDDVWPILWRFWVPANNMQRRRERDGVPYDTWAREGLITATPGNVVDYRQIRRDLGELGSRYAIEEIGYDPWNATQLAVELQDEDGFRMVEMRQGTRTLSEPCKLLEELVIEGRLAHGGHKVARWMAGNVAVRMDPNENIAPDKQASTERIDGIVAAVMALGRASVHAEQGFEVDYMPGQMFG